MQLAQNFERKSHNDKSQSATAAKVVTVSRVSIHKLGTRTGVGEAGQTTRMLPRAPKPKNSSERVLVSDFVDISNSDVARNADTRKAEGSH